MYSCVFFSFLFYPSFFCVLFVGNMLLFMFLISFDGTMALWCYLSGGANSGRRCRLCAFSPRL